MKIELFLPVPVSVNQLTHNNNSKNGGRGGRSKTKKAKAWYRDAQAHAMPFVKGHQTICNHNIMARGQYWNFKKKSYDLGAMQSDFADLSYTVEYRFYFNSARVRDVANFEKQLSDFLVDIGMLLDDSFIDKMTLIRAGVDKDNPRVEVTIETHTITMPE